MDYPIFANHAHIFPEYLRPQGTVEKLLELMEECEIEKAVCFAPFEGNFTFRGYDDVHNEFLAEALVGKKNLVGFGTIDFERDDMEQQVKEIVDYGFRGIKIHPAHQEIPVMGEKAQRVYQAAQENNLFISFHTGVHWHRIRDYQMLLFDEIAYCYPKLNFSMEHFGGYHFFKDALAVMVNNGRKEPDTVFAGWTTMQYEDNGLPDYWTHSDEELLVLLNQTEPTQHIFGLDFPYNGVQRTKESIQRIKNLEIDEQTKAAILGGNLKRVLCL